MPFKCLLSIEDLPKISCLQNTVQKSSANNSYPIKVLLVFCPLKSIPKSFGQGSYLRSTKRCFNLHLLQLFSVFGLHKPVHRVLFHGLQSIKACLKLFGFQDLVSSTQCLQKLFFNVFGKQKSTLKGLYKNPFKNSRSIEAHFQIYDQQNPISRSSVYIDPLQDLR